MLLALALLAAALVYWPGLQGEFMFDDHWNILSNEAVLVNDVNMESLSDAAASGRAGPLKRPVAMMSFALNHSVSGVAPWGWKFSNLLIHLTTGVVLFGFLRRLLRDATRWRTALDGLDSDSLAVLVAALWLLHPLNLTGVLYVVQRMTSLSALFVFAALWLYLLGRMRLLRGEGGGPLMVLALVVCMPLAVLSKETGALVPVFVFLIEWLGFGFADWRRYARAFRYLLIVLFALPVLAALSLLLLAPDLLWDGYAARPFNLVERLLTESRVMWSYVLWGLVPLRSLLGLFHDDIALSSSVLEPGSTLLALLAWVVLAAAALLGSKRFPLPVFALLFFLVGHSIESTILPLEIVYEHRNYLPLTGLLLLLVYGLACLARELQAPRVYSVSVLAFALFLAATTWLRAGDWSSLARFSAAQVKHHPESARSHYQMGRVYAQALTGTTGEGDAQQRNELFTRATNHFIVATELRSDFKDGLFGLLVLYSSNGLDVSPELFGELNQRLGEGSVSASDINQLNSLVGCVENGFCKLPSSELTRLSDSLRRNPALSPMLREHLHPVG